MLKSALEAFNLRVELFPMLIHKFKVTEYKLLKSKIMHTGYHGKKVV